MTKPKNDSIKIDGKKEASDLLARLDTQSRDRILAEISTKDPALAETLRKGLVSFDRILGLDSGAFQKVIRPIPIRILALAARGLSPDEESRFFSKLSERQGLALREEREALGPQKKSDVDLARQKIAEMAQELHERGEIDLFYQPKI